MTTSTKSLSGSLRASAHVPESFRASGKRENIEFSKLRFSQDHLYGRDKELELLKEANNRLGTREVVIVSGPSGTGKSVLGLQLRKHVKQRESFFIGGKFQQGRPYTAIRQAFQQLCDIIQRDPEKVDIVDTLKTQVGDQLVPLVNVFPMLVSLVPSLASDGNTPTNQTLHSKKRFVSAFCCLVRAVGSIRKLIMIIDDLQWADTESLDLLESMATDTRSKDGVVLICSTRELVQKEGSLLQRLAKHKDDENLHTCEIKLENLSVSHMSTMFQDLHIAEPDNLAKIVYRKTLGNAFFVVHFCLMLVEQDMLMFNFGTMTWRWSSEEIDKNTRVSENVTDMMLQKVANELDPLQKKLLLMATCLGSQFNEAALKTAFHAIYSDTQEEARSEKSSRGIIDETLQKSIDDGLLERYSRQSFRFSHDIIQEAVMKLEKKEELDRIKLSTGIALYRDLDDEEKEPLLFVIVDLLCSSNLTKTSSADIEGQDLASLCLKAGKKAAGLPAFDQASAYYQQGIDVLSGLGGWSADYNLMLDLYSSLAESQVCNGNHDQVEECFDEVQRNANRSPRDHLRTFLSIKRSLVLRNRPHRAVTEGIKLLSAYGCKLPSSFYVSHTLIYLARVKKRLKATGDISDLDPMTDMSLIETMQVLESLVKPLFMLESPLLPIVALKMILISTKHGLCAFSASAMAFFSFITCVYLGNPQAAEKHATQALCIVQKLDAKEVSANCVFTVNSFVFHWRRPVPGLMAPLIDAYKIGLETGDTDTALMSILFYIGFAYISGRPLVELERDLRYYSAQMKELDAPFMRYNALIFHQCTLNLIDKKRVVTSLNGQVFNKQNALESVNKTESGTLVATLEQNESRLAYYFGDYEKASDIISNGVDILKTTPASPDSKHVCCFNALIYYAMARKTNKRKYRKMGLRYHRIAKSWAKKGDPNVVHRVRLLDAELAYLMGKDMDSTVKIYEEAISLCARIGFTHDAALCNERLGDFYCNLPMPRMTDAKYYLSKARQLYEEWGANAKVLQLVKKYPSSFGHKNN